MREEMTEEELKALLKSRNAKIFHEDDMGCIAVTKETDGSRRCLAIMKWWHNGKYTILWDLEYSLIGRLHLKLGIYYIGIKGLYD